MRKLFQKYKSYFSNHLYLEADKPLDTSIKCNLRTCGCRINPMAWVSIKHRICFLENAKCGSSSLKYVLQIKPNQQDIPYAFFHHIRKNTNPSFTPVGFGGLPLTSLFYGDGPEKIFLKTDFHKLNGLLGKPRGKYHFMPFFGEHSLLLSMFPDYKFITNIRDPWKRFISCYRMFSDFDQPFRMLQRAAVTGSVINDDLNLFL